MSGWSAPAPGGTTATVAAPGARGRGAVGPGATTVVADPAAGTHWAAPVPPMRITHPTRTAAFTATGVLSVDTLPVLLVGAPYAAAATLSVAGVPRVPLPAPFAAGATLEVDVLVVGEDIEVDVAISTTGTLSVATVPVLGPHDAPLAAEATLSVARLPRFIREAAFGTDPTLSVVIVPRIPRAAPLSAAATLAVQALPRFTRAAGYSAAAALSVATVPRLFRNAAFAAGATLSVAVVTRTDVTDDFNRSDGPLGANWTTYAFGPDTSVVPRVVSNQFRAPDTLTNNQNNQCSALYTGTACTTDNMAATATMTAGENGLYMGALVRGDAAGNSYVLAVITSTTGTTGIHTRINGTVTRRTTSSTTIYAANDVFELRANGNVYTLIRNPGPGESTISTWTDSTNLFPVGAAQRHCGLYHNSDRNFFGTTNHAPPLDNFRMRDL